jgi:hypothetical protein
MKSLWMVTKEDLSHLGGPMGSEYTTTIWEKYFATEKEARAAIEKDMKKEKVDPDNDAWEKKTYWDCRWVGYGIKKINDRRKKDII